MASNKKTQNNIPVGLILGFIFVIIGAVAAKFAGGYRFLPILLIFAIVYIVLTVVVDILGLYLKNSRFKLGGNNKKGNNKQEKAEDESDENDYAEDTDYIEPEAEENIEEKSESYKKTQVGGNFTDNPFGTSRKTEEKEKLSEEKQKENTQSRKKEFADQSVSSKEYLEKLIEDSEKRNGSPKEQTEKNESDVFSFETTDFTEKNEKEDAEPVLEEVKEEENLLPETDQELPEAAEEDDSEQKEERELSDTEKLHEIVEKMDNDGKVESIMGIEEIENEIKSISESINATLRGETRRPVIFRTKDKTGKNLRETDPFAERPISRPKLYDADTEDNSSEISAYSVKKTEYTFSKDAKTVNGFDNSEETDDLSYEDEFSDENIDFDMEEQEEMSDEDVAYYKDYRPDKVVADRKNLSTLFGTGKKEEKEITKVVTVPEKQTPVKKKTVKYVLPSVEVLADHKDFSKNRDNDDTEIQSKADKLLSTLESFGINAKITNAQKGPSVTRYELQPEPGVKVSRILSLSDDIALSLASAGIRFEAPIPGKSAIGIEVPNGETDIVFLKDVLKSPEYINSSSKLSVGLGRDISGNAVVGDISKFPHVLIAGSTGSGKSVCINTIITSILFKASPDEVKFIMVDPKVVELGMYNGLPHLLVPVVTQPKKAAAALNWAVNEVEKRYSLFAEAKVRDLKGYKAANPDGKMPHIVIIIDELADLMMTSSKEVEDFIIRLAQKARAAGVHLIIATQRPSVDVITGLIKANIPSRIAFAVSSYVDSRTILDSAGAEKLLGRGDMLYHPIGMLKPKRVQGAFVSDEEVERLVNEIKKNYGETEYSTEVMNAMEKPEGEKQSPQSGTKTEEDDQDRMVIIEAGDLAVEYGQLSTSFLQRKFKLGFSRAARIVDALEENGVVSAAEGSKPRTTIISKEEWQKIRETL